MQIAIETHAASLDAPARIELRRIVATALGYSELPIRTVHARIRRRASSWRVELRASGPDGAEWLARAERPIFSEAVHDAANRLAVVLHRAETRPERDGGTPTVADAAARIAA